MQYLSLQFSISTNHLSSSLLFHSDCVLKGSVLAVWDVFARCDHHHHHHHHHHHRHHHHQTEVILRSICQTESSAPLDGIVRRDPQTHFCSERSSLVASHRWNLFTCFLGWICNHDWSERCWWRRGLVVSSSERSDCNWEMSPGAASDQNEMTRK